MKAQLVKRQDRFDLYNESDGSKIASTLPNPMGKLSLKNCEAIENGYDLDELAGEYANKELNVELTSKAGNFYGFSSSFKEGFQKALEILGDKKFTKEDMGRIMVYGYDKSTENEYLSRIPFDEYIQSLQQTEWDVEIETEEKRIGGIKGYGEYEIVPKLDEDGCLILKRK